MAERWPQPGEEKATDDELVARTRHGDREAFGALWDRHYHRIYGFCFRCLGDREAAEDATSETFRKALAALPTYRERLFQAWLYAIARNVVSDARRATRPTVALEDAAAIHADGPTPEEVAMLRGASDEIAALLARLSPDQQEVIALRLTGLEPTEIAQVSGKSRAAVDMIHYRALVRLRTLLGVNPKSAGGSEDD